VQAPNCYYKDTTGENSYTSYEFKQRGLVTSGMPFSSVGQDVSGFLVGGTYQLYYGSWWSTCDQNLGYVNVKLNGQSVATIHPCDGYVGGLNWADYIIGPFTAVSSVENLTFEFVISVGQSSCDIRLDNIAITEF